MTITRAQVDALRYGDLVRLEINGGVFEGPVGGRNGYKHVGGRALRDPDYLVGTTYVFYDEIENYDGSVTFVPCEVTYTGYDEDALAHGTLTVLATGKSPGGV